MSLLNLPKAQKNILELLSLKNRSLTELSTQLDMSKAGALKHLDSLMGNELIRKEMIINEKGRESIYSLNRTTYLLSIDPESDSILELKTHSIFEFECLLVEQVPQQEFRDDLRTFFTEMKNKPFAIVYGSVARGEGTWKSDIDILFLGEKWKNQERVEDNISEINMKLKHQIKPLFRTFSEFKKDDHLSREIKEDGIIIYNDLFSYPNVWKQMKRYRNFIL